MISCDKNVGENLQSHVTEGVYHTHVDLILKQKYLYNRQDLGELWELYNCSIEENPNAVFGIAEKASSYIPVLVDVDIKIPDENVYNEEHTKSVIETYQSVLRKIVEDCNDEDLTCVLLEKSMYKQKKGDITLTCRGFHLHFPWLILSKTDMEIHLIPRVQDILRKSKAFLDLGFEDSGKVIDTSCFRVPWLMYGSRKSPHKEPYKVTKVYTAEGKIIDLETAFKYYILYDYREQIINITGNVEHYLPQILSIIPYGRDTKDLKHGLVLHCKEKKRNVRKYNIVSVSKSLKIAAKLLPMLSQYRTEDRNEWMTVGWVLFNIGEGSQEALDLWLTFSERDELNYDETVCISEWNGMVKKVFSVGTLRYYASIDNPEIYSKFKDEEVREKVSESISGSHNDIAKVLYAKYGDEFVCSSPSSNTWYWFNGNTWELAEEGIFLRKKISDELGNYYTEIGSKVFGDRPSGEIINIEDKAEEAAYRVRFSQVQKLVQNLRNCGFKSSVMKEAIEVFYDKRFRSKLDNNPYIIAFKNGVYDLKLNTLRPGRPEDFLSKSLDIDYIEYRKDDPKVIEIMNYLEKVFPDISIKTYFMDISSDVFVGGNHQKIVQVWNGDGDNAKSVTQHFFEKMLGKLAIKLPTTLITGKKPASGAANAELARTGGGVRMVVVEEPDGDEVINVGTLKVLSGNDSFYARELFQKGRDVVEIKPMFKFVLITNNLLKMRNADKATFNRVKVIPFESTFCRSNDPAPETYAEQLRQKRFPMDTNFSKKIPSLVSAFAWVLLEHRKNLKVRFEPEKVRSATALYRKKNDIYRQFIEEQIMEDDMKLSLAELYTTFKEWYKESMPGQNMPVKNDVKEYFIKLWGDIERGSRWTGYRIRTLEDDIEEGEAVLLTVDERVEYGDDDRMLPPM
jgi:P4 family phage/plasmid primase-like protien